MNVTTLTLSLRNQRNLKALMNIVGTLSVHFKLYIRPEHPEHN